MNDGIRVSNYDGGDYPKLWVEKQRRYENEIEHIVISELLPEKGDWFADFGCAHGRLADIYVNRFKHCIMLDYSIRHLEMAKKRLAGNDNITYMAADIYKLPLRADLLDAAIMVRVIHHIERPDIAYEGIARILKPHSRFITNYRNRRDLRNIIRFLLRMKNDGPFQVTHDDPSGQNTLQAFTHPKYARRLLNNAGFEIRRTRGTSFFGGKFLRIVPKPASIEAYLYHILGMLKLSPLIFMDLEYRRASGDNAVTAESIADILVCPDCREKLESTMQKYRCGACGKDFPIVNGIINFHG